MENMRKKVEWLEKNDNNKLIELWENYMYETSDPYNVYKMDDFDETFSDFTPKEIMQFSNGNFNPNHKYYAYNENITAYISFNKITDYECYIKEKENFVMFLKK